MRALLHFATLVLRCVPALARTRSEQALVELATYAQKRPEPRIAPLDRSFWISLFRFSSRWRDTLLFVRPETVVRWHRAGFRLYWRSISKPGPGRPRISTELRGLIRTFATENGWGARKVHAELGKLGFSVSLATVSRYLPRNEPNDHKRQQWTTFLRNHRDAIAAMDFLVVPTARFELLYVWFFLDHERRRVLNFNVTAHPAESWTIQQLREAFPGEHSRRFLVHDNDCIFSARLTRAIGHLGLESKPTSYRSPSQSAGSEASEVNF